MNILNIVSVVTILLLGLLLTTFIIWLSVAIVFSTRSGMKYRRALAGRLDQLRLGRMLAALGIDTDSYLSRERAVDIHKHMERCAACANTAECDTRLDEGTMDVASISYCNNETSLQKIAAQQKNQATAE